VKTINGLTNEELPNTPLIRGLYDLLVYLQSRVNDTETALSEAISIFQRDCDHSFEDVTLPDNSNVLLGARCIKCSLFHSKVEGPLWKTCPDCGGQMEFTGIYRNGLHRYVCAKCHKDRTCM